MPFFEEFLAQDDRVQRQARDANNAGRLAFSEHTLETKGTGQFRVAAPLMFDLTFTEEPRVVTGFSVGKTPKEAEGVDAFAMSGVRAWLRDDRGFYIGATIIVKIDLFQVYSSRTDFPADLAERMVVIHHFLFSGMAFKDLKDVGRAEVQANPSRTPTSAVRP